jgi:hypothetical protein
MPRNPFDSLSLDILQFIIRLLITDGASLSVMPVFVPTKSDGWLHGRKVNCPDELDEVELKEANASLKEVADMVARMSRFLAFPKLMLTSRCFIKGIGCIHEFMQPIAAFAGNGWYRCQGYRNYHFWTWFGFGHIDHVLKLMKDTQRGRTDQDGRLHATVEIVLAGLIDRALRANNQITVKEIWSAVVDASNLTDAQKLKTPDLFNALEKYKNNGHGSFVLKKVSGRRMGIVYTVSFGPQILEVSVVTEKSLDKTPGNQPIQESKLGLYVGPTNKVGL